MKKLKTFLEKWKECLIIYCEITKYDLNERYKDNYKYLSISQKKAFQRQMELKIRFIKQQTYLDYQVIKRILNLKINKKLWTEVIFNQKFKKNFLKQPKIKKIWNETKKWKKKQANKAYYKKRKKLI